MPPRLILASSSPFRRALLNKLALPYQCQAPDIDESPLAGESAEALVRRLALQKAQAVAVDNSDALIIGSDQVALLDGQILGKPLEHARAVAQLQAASGRRVRFLTGLCLYDSRDRSYQLEAVPFDVQFRVLSAAQIEYYLHHEQPYQCAGSFKSEGLGIALFECLEGEDPNTLIGLPLIRLIRMLAQAGVDVLDPAG